MKVEYAVFIGRFQIPHHGHFYVIKEALKKANKLILAIGSSNVGRSLKNPFTFEQRASMFENCDVPEITAALREGRIIFVPLEDSVYSDTWWVEQVQRKVKNVTGDIKSIALVGCKKDESSYYLDMFPQWDLIEVEQTTTYAATECRNAYYEFGPHDKTVQNKLYDFTTMGVINALKYIPDFVHTSLQKRFFAAKVYKEEWGEGPFETVDAVLVKNGHVLVIKRAGESYNDDLWALPGGFIEDTDATPYFAALRELREETGYVVQWYDRELEIAKCVAEERFEGKDRDERAHINTTAFLLKLVDGGPLPEVKGLDDAKEAKWVPLVDLRADNMFNDHYFIIRKLIGQL